MSSFDYSALAQLVEQLTVNQRVAGSSPAGGAISSLQIPVLDARTRVNQRANACRCPPSSSPAGGVIKIQKLQGGLGYLGSASCQPAFRRSDKSAASVAYCGVPAKL